MIYIEDLAFHVCYFFFLLKVEDFFCAFTYAYMPILISDTLDIWEVLQFLEDV